MEEEAKQVLSFGEALEEVVAGVTKRAEHRAFGEDEAGEATGLRQEPGGADRAPHRQRCHAGLEQSHLDRGRDEAARDGEEVRRGQVSSGGCRRDLEDL